MSLSTRPETWQTLILELQIKTEELKGQVEKLSRQLSTVTQQNEEVTTKINDLRSKRVSRQLPKDVTVQWRKAGAQEPHKITLPNGQTLFQILDDIAAVLDVAPTNVKLIGLMSGSELDLNTKVEDIHDTIIATDSLSHERNYQVLPPANGHAVCCC